MTSTQRDGFATLIHALVHADGRLAAQEQVILDRIIAESGEARPILGGQGVEDALLAFGTVPVRRAAMIELIAVCWADEEIADEEAALLDRIADAWSILPDERAAMLDWVRRQAGLYSEARILVAGGV